jgi:hypothetical protein
VVEKTPSKELTDSIGENIRDQVAEGFDDPDDIIESVVEMFSDEADEDVLRPLAERLTAQAVQSHLQVQADWPESTDCDRLDLALDELTTSGIVCRQHFSCCRNCGLAEIGGEMDEEAENGVAVRGYAFFHVQCTESAVETGWLHLYYGAVEEDEDAVTAIGREIVEVLHSHDLVTDWNGQGDTAIGVQVDWKRRRMPDGSADLPVRS